MLFRIGMNHGSLTQAMAYDSGQARWDHYQLIASVFVALFLLPAGIEF
jgi:hypothetical protein